MDKLDKLRKEASKRYNAGENPFDAIEAVAIKSLELLSAANVEDYGKCGAKSYNVFSAKGEYSRPFIPSLLIADAKQFQVAWNNLLDHFDSKNHKINLSENDINSVIYTSIMSFACSYDLWKSKSRKTPGTFFEVIIGSILGALLPDHTRSKHIALPGYDEKVSTDIAYIKNGNGLVIPAKITTRERIVQPIAHQRILDGVYGKGHYRSVLVSVSETQRDNDTSSVNEICVPGTIRLFSEHIAQLSGIYYLDPPARYLKEDVTSIVNVRSLGSLLSSDLEALITW